MRLPAAGRAGEASPRMRMAQPSARQRQHPLVPVTTERRRCIPGGPCSTGEFGPRQEDALARRHHMVVTPGGSGGATRGRLGVCVGRRKQMPELVVDLITSLDGYASAEGWPGWWGLEGPAYLGWLEALPEKDRVVLMCATTYRLMSQMSAAAASEWQDDFRPDEADSLTGLDGMSKVVFSSTF